MEASILGVQRLHGLQALNVDAVILIVDDRIASSDKRGLAQELVGLGLFRQDEIL